MQLVDMQERKILVTGASSGIGRAVSILASKLGASVVLCARDKERLEETRSMMSDAGKHQCISFDVREFENYDSIFGKAVSDGVKLNGMVHCAGIAKISPLRMMKQPVITEIMDINFNSFMNLMGMYTKKKYSNGGSVVAVSSSNAHYPQKCMSIYAASKAALESAVRTLALETVQQNIRVNCVIPGAIDTPMMRMTDEDALERTLEKQLLGAGQPIQVANMILFLLSDAASFITGRSVFVDGGMLGQ